ncbi:DNA-binding domain-containing protein [Rhodobacteraceae bacterium N5(2021)]|uniref:DNA-binding domain-containing protein n=1 Tax=Gymnodinialimonas phycosphaerae TaxID=2841589 RepID=A0A975TV99_9RHOB|nr:DNA-binding domain-containing protein [Gymnodinialimonas phycosphaerae]MBY4895286.1 DNA-binding domain-containing protein [Gymnodinialimonas phycosphaerae]
MTSLRDMQVWMQNALIDPQGVRTAEVAQHLVPSNRLSAGARLGIYQRSYITRLCACLAEQFPASRHALGAALFDQFARVYLAEAPSDSYTLYELGRRFPAFLEASRPDADAPEAWVDFMLDLARYERALFVLFDAPGHEGKHWPTVDTPDADLVLQPCFVIGAYRFPVAQYYHSVTDQAEPSLPPMVDSFVAIARYDYVTSSFPISRLHYGLLSAMQEVGRVGAALALLAQREGVPEDQVHAAWAGQIRARWIENRFFVSKDA